MLVPHSTHSARMCGSLWGGVRNMQVSTSMRARLLECNYACLFVNLCVRVSVRVCVSEGALAHRHMFM